MKEDLSWTVANLSYWDFLIGEQKIWMARAYCESIDFSLHWEGIDDKKFKKKKVEFIFPDFINYAATVSRAFAESLFFLQVASYEVFTNNVASPQIHKFNQDLPPSRSQFVLSVAGVDKDIKHHPIAYHR